MKLKDLLQGSYTSIATLIAISVRRKFNIESHVIRRILRQHNHCMECERQDKFEEGTGYYCCCVADTHFKFWDKLNGKTH